MMSRMTRVRAPHVEQYCKHASSVPKSAASAMNHLAMVVTCSLVLAGVTGIAAAAAGHGDIATNDAAPQLSVRRSCRAPAPGPAPGPDPAPGPGPGPPGGHRPNYYKDHIKLDESTTIHVTPHPLERKVEIWILLAAP